MTIFESGLLDLLATYICLPNHHGNSISLKHQNIFWPKLHFIRSSTALYLPTSPRLTLERKKNKTTLALKVTLITNILKCIWGILGLINFE